MNEENIDGDLIALSHFIDNKMKEYIKNNPVVRIETECIRIITGEVMKNTKGRMNLSIVEYIIRYHRKLLEEAGYCLQC